MRRMLTTGLAALGAVAFLGTPVPAKALMIAPAPIPERVALADVVVIGKLGKVEEKNVSALPVYGGDQKVEYQVLALQVEDALTGVKGQKEIRVAFVPQQAPEGRPIRPIRPGLTLATGQEGCFFLTKHPQESFYVPQMFFDVLDKKGANYEKEAAEVKRCAKLLADPDASLKSKDADERLLTASMLIARYRTPKAGKAKAEPIDAAQSKLILQTLAEADWTKNDPGLRGGVLQLFQRLGVTEKDGWKPPTRKDPKTGRDLIDGQAMPAAAKKWVADNADKYRIQKFVAEK